MEGQSAEQQIAELRAENVELWREITQLNASLGYARGLLMGMYDDLTQSQQEAAVKLLGTHAHGGG